jgi:hypothetical protein
VVFKRHEFTSKRRSGDKRSFVIGRPIERQRPAFRDGKVQIIFHRKENVRLLTLHDNILFQNQVFDQLSSHIEPESSNYQFRRRAPSVPFCQPAIT